MAIFVKFHFLKSLCCATEFFREISLFKQKEMIWLIRRMQNVNIGIVQCILCACMPFRFKTFQIFKFFSLNNSCREHMEAADQLHIWSQLWYYTNTKNGIDFYETTFFYRSNLWERTYVFSASNMNRTKATYQCRCRSGTTSTLHFSFFAFNE